MTTLLLTIPLPASPTLRAHFGDTLLVCTKGHSDALTGQVAETHFYERTDLPEGGKTPSALDVEMIAGCLARLLIADAPVLKDYARDIFGHAESFLDQNKVDSVLFRTGPHLPHEMAIYRVAKRDGLKIGMYEETSYFARAFLFPGMDRRSLKTALWAPDRPYALEPDQAAAIVDSTKLKEHYFGIHTAKTNSVADIVKSAVLATGAVVKSRLSGAPLAGTSRTNDNPLRPSLTGALDYWRQNISRTISSERYFLSKVASPDCYAGLGENDIVFYGNYAPERTIFPDSYPYHDFLSALSLLGDFKTRIWREHPTQFRLPGRPYMLRGGFSKGPDFYRAVQRQGWIVGPTTFPSDAILQSRAMIACLNGTVAFDAMLKRRPAIAFAKNWYLDLPNVSTAESRSFDLDYDPLDIVSNAFAKTFPRIDFWALAPRDLETLGRSIELVRAQTTGSDPQMQS